MRVLVVDDNDLAREALSAVVNSLGHEVASVANGHEALDRLLQDEVDLLLMDVVMPGIDGYSVARLVRESPAWDETAIVLVTGVDDIREYEQVLDLGINGFLRKPMKRIELAALMITLKALKDCRATVRRLEARDFDA